MSIGLCLSLSVGLRLGSQVLGLCLCFRMSMCMHMCLSLQVLRFSLSFQTLCMCCKALSLGSNLHVGWLGDRLIALSMQILSMSLHSQPNAFSIYKDYKEDVMPQMGRQCAFFPGVAVGIWFTQGL